MQSYMEQFHNLGGKTLGEHQRNFRYYLTVISGLPQTEIISLLNSINPKNHQEEIFHTKLLLHFNQHDRVLKIFVTCNKVLNRIIVKDKNFIEFITSRFGAQGFVNELCPRLSYVARSIVINKLGLYLKNGDDFFQEVCAKYGLRAATRILPACSDVLIKEQMEDNSIDFTDRELIRLHKKYPNFLKFYFDTMDIYLNSRILLVDYLTKNDMECLNLLSKNGMPRLGRKSFMKFLQVNKEYVIDHPGDFYKHRSRIYRYFNEEEYKKYLKNLLPKNIDDLCWMGDIIACLEYMPIQERYKIFCEIYKDLYSSEYKDFQQPLLHIISLEDRQKFDLKDNWELYPLNEAIEKIKHKIDLSQEINLRSSLINKLIETCKINKDEDMLLHVLKYFCTRHKNDTVDVRKNFLSCLSNNFNLLKLSEEHWKYINEILLIFEINGDSYYDKSSYLKKSILMKMRRGDNCDDELVKLLSEAGKYGDWRFMRNYPIEERECLLKYPQLWGKVKHLKQDRACVKFLETIQDYNKNSPKQSISYYSFPEILQCFQEKINKSDDPREHTALINSILRYIPNTEEENQLRDQMIEDFFSNKKNFVKESLFIWVLKYRPHLIRKDVETILKKVGNLSRFYYEISKMHYNGLSEAFNNASLMILADEKQVECVPKMLWSLAYHPKYLDLVKRFAPTADCKIDLYSENIKLVLGIQKVILKSLKIIFKQSDNIPTILHYSNGDYLQYALEPMYRSLYHTPECFLEEPLKVILSRSVSVRKHSIYLSTVLLPMNKIEESLKEYGLQENNGSVKKFIFKCNFSCFSNNPTRIIFELLKSHLSLLDPNDSESLDMIYDFQNVPKKYFVDYVSLMWDYADSRTEYHKYKILAYIEPKIIEKLPQNICDDMMLASLFNTNNSYSSETYKFVYHYIMSSKMNTVQSVFNILKKIACDADKINREYFVMFQDICKLLLKEDNKTKAIEISKQLVDAFITNSLNKFEIEILLKFVSHYLSNDGNNLALFVVKQQSDLMERFGAELLVYYSKVIKKCLYIIHTAKEADLNENNYAFVQELLEVSTSTHVKLLAIQLLPAAPSKNVIHKQYHDNIKKELLKDPNPLIKIFLEFNMN